MMKKKIRKEATTGLLKKETTTGLLKYARELSIVIIGVLITILITTSISNYSKKKEAKEAMNLIRIELEDNLKKIEWSQQKWENEQKIYALIRQHLNNIKEIPIDTLETYRKAIGDKHSLDVNSDSYNVFQTSLLMQYIKDKQLLRELSKTYNLMSLVSNKLSHYSGIKGDGITHIINNIDKENLDKWMYGNTYDFFNIPLKDNVFLAFIYTGNNLLYSQDFEECRKKINAVIHQINKEEY